MKKTGSENKALTASRSREGLRTLVSRLEKSAPVNAEKEATELYHRLRSLHQTLVVPALRWPETGRIFARAMFLVDTQIPLLGRTSFPVSRKSRLLVRALQNLLALLAEDLSAPAEADEVGAPAPALRLWQALRTLSCHLLISYLTAAPPGKDIWLNLHQCYRQAQALGVDENTPPGCPISLQSLYYSAALLGCAQPSAFTSGEITFIADYLELFADQTDPGSGTSPESPTAFWIDPTQDTPPMACARKPAPPETEVHYFCCDRIVELLRNQLDSLESGAPPAQIGLPEFAAQAAGHGILRRLIAYWGNPGKRRFPRRRQSYRAELCCGLDNLWQVFRETPGLPVETSHWMVINESPDGYAVMHVSGNPGAIAAGDIAAIRTETSDRWQTCIVRWAISENQEHLELGLQILASKAIPATLTLQLPGKEETEKLPVLILPSVPPLRPLQMLVVPPGVLDTEPKHLVLMIEKRNLELREVRNTALDEQNSQIEIFSIEPDSYPT